jgi:hypothetical protein
MSSSSFGGVHMEKGNLADSGNFSEMSQPFPYQCFLGQFNQFPQNPTTTATFPLTPNWAATT